MKKNPLSERKNRQTDTEDKILHIKMEGLEEGRQVDNRNVNVKEVSGSSFLLPSNHSHNYQKLSSTVLRILFLFFFFSIKLAFC